MRPGWPPLQPCLSGHRTPEQSDVTSTHSKLIVAQTKSRNGFNAELKFKYEKRSPNIPFLHFFVSVHVANIFPRLKMLESPASFTFKPLVSYNIPP